MSTAIVPGSLSAIAKRDNLSIAESFLSADVIVLIDVSGSMDARDSRGGARRFDAAVDELRTLQANLPGRIAVVAFSSGVQFVPGGVPPFLSGGTDLAAALRFVKVADGTVQFIVISDGIPDSADEAIQVAQTFSSRIDVVYVGPEHYRASARFLERLAAAAGGRCVLAEKAHELASTVQRLMLSAGT